jgi:hypothetical protein
MRYANSLVYATIFLLSASSSVFAADTFAQQITAALQKSSSYRVRYVNPAISPRTIYDVQDINNDGADFDVRVKCFPYNCEHSAKFVQLLSSAKKVAEACQGPPYLRIDFVAFDGTKEELSMAVNYSGECITFDGNSYGLSENLIWKFYQTPIKDW